MAVTGADNPMDANPVAVRSILSSIAAGFVFRIVGPLERFFSYSVNLQQRRGKLVRAHARKYNVYLVPEILDPPEQCPCSQHTTFMLVHSAKRSYCFDCWNAHREAQLTQASTFQLNLSVREWRTLHYILTNTSSNLRRLLDGQPAEYFELRDFDLFVHMCEGIIEAWGPEKAFRSPAVVPRDTERITADLDLQEINLVRMSAVAAAEMWQAPLEPGIAREIRYEMIPKAEWPDSIWVIDLLLKELTRNLLLAEPIQFNAES